MSELFDLPLPILILQHPQEPSRSDADISSAKMIAETLKHTHIRVGLSHRNLKAALKGFQTIEENPEFENPKLWATLYLGTKAQSQEKVEISEPGIYFLDKKGEPKSAPENGIGGIILLDGTWAQAKTLWWRNAWLLKTHRIMLVPKEKSKYGTLRKEPRSECVSTLEALAETLSFMGISTEIENALKQKFQSALQDFKFQKKR